MNTLEEGRTRRNEEPQSFLHDLRLAKTNYMSQRIFVRTLLLIAIGFWSLVAWRPRTFISWAVLWFIGQFIVAVIISLIGASWTWESVSIASEPATMLEKNGIRIKTITFDSKERPIELFIPYNDIGVTQNVFAAGSTPAVVYIRPVRSDHILEGPPSMIRQSQVGWKVEFLTDPQYFVDMVHARIDPHRRMMARLETLVNRYYETQAEAFLNQVEALIAERETN